MSTDSAAAPAAAAAAVAEPIASTSRPPKAPRAPPASRHLIREGDNVLIKLPSGVLKAIKISIKANVPLGKYGTFKAKDLVGKPYGHTYEIVDGGLQVMQATLNEIEETAANNENISSTGAQKLTFIDIEALRNEGLSGREIIAKQVEEHSAFELKTEYSKDKYMKRKEAKYLQVFTPIEPTVHNICDYNFEKDADKIRQLRPDTLSQIMTMANVRPGGKLLVVDDVHGMVVAAAVERMGGEGRILVINGVDSPPDLHLLDSFNFNPDDLAPITSMHFAATEEAWAPPALPLDLAEVTAGKAKNTRDVIKIKKRKAVYDKAKETRDEYFNGGFDGVILACEYEPYSVLERLLPSIAGSAPVIVYSPYLPVLYSLQTALRANPDFLAPSISEPWLRKYQVLPGRTHPEMGGMQHGGFILAVTRVFDDAEASSFASGRRAAKRKKLENKKLEGDEAPAGVEKGGEEVAEPEAAVGKSSAETSTALVVEAAGKEPEEVAPVAMES